MRQLKKPNYKILKRGRNKQGAHFEEKDMFDGVL